MSKLHNSAIVRYAAIWMVGLMILAIAGFWQSYFSKLFSVEGSFNGYFHFHAVMASLWIIILIVQPMLIRSNRFSLHRRIGKIGHAVMVLFFISVILLTHHQLSATEPVRYISAFIPFRDLVVLIVAYTIAMWNAQVVGIHARAMIATGVAFIEPSLIRAIAFMAPDLEDKYLWTIGITYTIIILLMIISRKHKRGQWVFPLIIGIYIIAHTIILMRLPFGFFEDAVDWFIGLPLT